MTRGIVVGKTTAVDALGLLSNLVEPMLQADYESSPPELVKRVRRQRRLKPDEVDELVAMYESGLCVNKLAAAAKIHRTTVMAHLRCREVVTRRNVRKLNAELAQQALQLYVGGLSLAAAGARLGVSAEVVRQQLIRFGVERRPPGRRKGSEGSI